MHLTNFTQFIIESIASDQAHELGLRYKGHGYWTNKQGETVAQTVNGQLIKLEAPTAEPIDKNTSVDHKKPTSQGGWTPQHLAEPKSAADIMFIKLGGKKGSSEGGFYKGKDGVERYVKFYTDPEKGHCEILASHLYNDLGLGAPKCQMFPVDGQTDAFSSIIIPGKQLGETGGKHGTTTKELADKVFDGYAADVLMANWDAIGHPMDNIQVGNDGNLYRIDNGGAFLYKGLDGNGKKPNNALNNVTEWDNFGTELNPWYNAVFKARGITKVEELGAERLAKQIENITNLEKKVGGWAKYVSTVVPGMSPENKKKCVDMLNARTKWLTAKHQQLSSSHAPITGTKAGTTTTKVKPSTPVNTTSAPKLTAEQIMHKKVGNQQGTNEGGFYEGTDGKERYVKMYKDPSRAVCESLCDNLYRELGIGAPVSHTFSVGDKIAFASDILVGAKELGQTGLSPNICKKILEGFAADVLTANWDAVGLEFDNIVVDENDTPYRIDGGGSFLFRAMESSGRKPEELLNGISEWDAFFNKNPAYSQVFEIAGIGSPDEMADEIKDQVNHINIVRNKFGGWENVVETFAGDLNPQDKASVIKMLVSRNNALNEKVKTLL